MIERKMFYYYVVNCDNCGRPFQHDYLYERHFRNKVNVTKQILERSLAYFGWKRKDSKWYCPDCQKGKKRGGSTRND